MRARAFVIILFLSSWLVSSCQSELETPKIADKEVDEQPEVGVIEVAGTPEDLAWFRRMTETLRAAELAFELGDADGALGTADSLRMVTESLLDTIPQESNRGRFLLVYAADVYGRLRVWRTMGGDVDGVASLSRQYEALVRRLHAQRDTISSESP